MNNLRNRIDWALTTDYDRMSRDDYDPDHPDYEDAYS